MLGRHPILIILLISGLFTYGCAGRSPDPVKIKQIDDRYKNCKTLLNEITEIEFNIAGLSVSPEKTPRNIFLSFAGVFFYPFWLFMDLKDADKIELKAYKNRFNYLATIYNNNNCTNGKVNLIKLYDEQEFCWFDYFTKKFN